MVDLMALMRVVKLDWWALMMVEKKAALLAKKSVDLTASCLVDWMVALRVRKRVDTMAG